MKELTPIRENPEDYDEILHRILDLLRDEIYLPLIVIIKAPKKTIKNSREDLLEAIRVGRVFFSRGVFTGRFNSSISKELREMGAKWKGGAYHLPSSKLGYDIRSAISSSIVRFQQMTEKADRVLAQKLPEQIADKLKLEDIFESTLWSTDKKIAESMKGITVHVKLTPEQAKRISEEYTHDMKRYIKDWTEKEIVSLRNKIKESTLAGNRYETLVKTIQKSYGTSVSKANFLARQETSLMMAKFKETRYSAAGVKEYIWRTVVGSPKHPVRPMHKKLDGKIFSWDNPPVTSEDGRRNNPGQDYNCRCTAVPVIK